MGLSERAAVALEKGDVIGGRAIAEDMMAGGAEPGVPHALGQAMAVRAAVAGAQEDRDLAYELLTEALVVAREARRTDLEAGLLTQLGHWCVQGGRLDEARRYIHDAIHIAEHGQLRLRQADAANMLSQLEHASGNRHEAARAARDAYRLAWCDGPPFAYEKGIRQARENLAAAGEQEPAGLAAYEPSGPMPELLISPTSPAEALSLRPPLADDVLIRIIGLLPKGDESVMSLQTLYESPASSPEVRAAAHDELVRFGQPPGPAAS